MSLPSGSHIHRAMLCPASAVLPQTASASEASEKGRALHAYLADLQSMSPEEALDRVPGEHRDACEALDVSQLPTGADWRPEVALVYDIATDTTRHLGYNVGRQYGKLKPTEIPMSLDLVGLFPEGGFVADFKTGHGKVTAAPFNWQLRVGALAVSRWKGLERVRVALLFPREDGGEWGCSPGEFDGFDLYEMQGELRGLLGRLSAPDAASKVCVGDHCRYCPAFTACPAQTAMVRRMAGEPEAVGEDIRELLTPETAAKAYERLRAVRAVIGRVEAALYAYASQAPIQLPEGRVFGPVEVSKEKLNADVVRKVLAGIHGPEVAESACERSTSKAAVGRAIKAAAKALKERGEKVSAAALEREAMAAIRAEGGVETVTRTEMRETRAALPEGTPIKDKEEVRGGDV